MWKKIGDKIRKKWKVKRIIKRLEAKILPVKGKFHQIFYFTNFHFIFSNGTSMVSMVIPPKETIQ